MSHAPTSLGMLNNSETIKKLIEFLKKYKTIEVLIHYSVASDTKTLCFKTKEGHIDLRESTKLWVELDTTAARIN